MLVLLFINIEISKNFHSFQNPIWISETLYMQRLKLIDASNQNMNVYLKIKLKRNNMIYITGKRIDLECWNMAFLIVCLIHQ